jgi:DNA polymerase-3 subunit epsilon/exodeoxyribonuclease X
VAYKFLGAEKESLFKPPVPIEIEAMSVTHITNKAVMDKEPFIGSEMFKDLEGIFAAGNILVAHNADFDAGILKKEGLRTDKIIDNNKIEHHLDVDGEIPRHSLQYLSYYFDL